VLSLREYLIICATLAIDITDEEFAYLMEDTIDLSKGGIGVVAYSGIGYVKEYANNPSIRFIDCSSIKAEELESLVHSNTRVIILTTGLPQWHYVWLTSYARRRTIPFLVRKTTQAVYDTIKTFFPDSSPKVSLEKVKEVQTRGRLNQLIEFIDWNKSNNENAKNLMYKANELGIRTTEGSLVQLVSRQRRKKPGVNAVPRSARSQLDVSVELLDQMIKDLGSIRDYLINITEENRMFRQKIEKIKKGMED